MISPAPIQNKVVEPSGILTLNWNRWIMYVSQFLQKATTVVEGDLTYVEQGNLVSFSYNGSSDITLPYPALVTTIVRSSTGDITISAGQSTIPNTAAITVSGSYIAKKGE